MSFLTQWMDRTLYPHHEHLWDEQLLRERVLELMEADHVALDLGAGRGYKPTLNLLGNCAVLAGVDPDPSVLENPYLDEAKLLEPPDFLIPYPDERFDLVYSNSVIEHVGNPGLFFCEIARVLRPGGMFIGKTPNRRHYVARLARITPHAFHETFNRLRGRLHVDTFPTVYRCNTPAALQQTLTDAGLEIVRLDTVEGRPEYLRISFPTYVCGWLYERIVNSTAWFARWRAVIYVHARKASA